MGDEFLGYDQPDFKNKWWMDLKDVDGELTVPECAGARDNFKPSR